MISVQEAQQIIDREIKPLPSKKVTLGDAVGRVLAQDIAADTDFPPFDRSQMDGYAVRSEDVVKASPQTPVKLRLVGESAAGKGFDKNLEAGEAVRIMTGARIPLGADSVQKKELAREFEEERKRVDYWNEDPTEDELAKKPQYDLFVEIKKATKFCENYTLQGEEVEAGSKIYETGRRISAPMIAPLAAFGLSEVEVVRRPKIVIMATGSEIVEITETPQKDQIRNSNSATLGALCDEAGAICEILPNIADDLELLKTRISEVCQLGEKTDKRASRCDILILSGGVSVGDYDLTKPALRELGAEIFFEKVAMRPGKPTVFAKLGETFIFALPGNPVSAAVAYYLFVRQAILQMQNSGQTHLRKGTAILGGRLKGTSGRDSYLPITIAFDFKGRVIAKPIKWNGSSDFVSFAGVEALALVRAGEKTEKDSIIEIYFLPQV